MFSLGWIDYIGIGILSLMTIMGFVGLIVCMWKFGEFLLS